MVGQRKFLQFKILYWVMTDITENGLELVGIGARS